MKHSVLCSSLTAKLCSFTHHAIKKAVNCETSLAYSQVGNTQYGEVGGKERTFTNVNKMDI